MWKNTPNSPQNASIALFMFCQLSAVCQRVFSSWISSKRNCCIEQVLCMRLCVCAKLVWSRKGNQRNFVAKQNTFKLSQFDASTLKEWVTEIGAHLFMGVRYFPWPVACCRYCIGFSFGRKINENHWFSHQILAFSLYLLLFASFTGVASITAEFGECLMVLVRIEWNLTLNLFYRKIFKGTFPIDTTKTRLQIQGQKHDQQFNKLRYNGMCDAFMKIARQEGVKALYSG